MKRLLLVWIVSLLVVALAGPALSEDESPGFVMTGADAAYANFLDGECNVEVGYVWAKRVKYFHGETVRPHHDIQVRLTGACPGFAIPADGFLDGVENLTGYPSGIVKLVSADATGLEPGDAGIVIFDEVTGVSAVVDLTWTAEGDVYTEVFREPGLRASHRTVDATVVGTVEVAGLGTFTVADHLRMGEYAPRITHFSTIVKENLP